MGLVILGLVVIPALIAAAAVVTARDRWGTRRVPIAQGEGAYRSGEVGMPVPREVPLSVSVSAIASCTWGAVTMFLLAPAGGVLLLLVSERAGAAFPTLLVITAVVLSGFAHAIALFVAGAQVARHHPLAAATARKAAAFAWWHHAAVLVGFTLCVLFESPELAPATLFFLAIPCGIGALVGASLHAAGQRIAAIDRADATARHAELFVPSPA
ncbi:MAG: hypothetical protein M3Y87_23850 [Myxococcota bacterium]|nr:hypothetical protein [Myxococcota bacterium]